MFLAARARISPRSHLQNSHSACYGTTSVCHLLVIRRLPGNFGRPGGRPARPAPSTIHVPCWQPARRSDARLALFPVVLLLAVPTQPMDGMPRLDPRMREAAVKPMKGIYPIMAMQHDLQGMAAAAMLLTTAASFVSINLLLSPFRVSA